MSDFMLRSPTESDLDDALISAGVAQEVTDGDGEVTVQPINGITIDRIGPSPATVDEEGIIITPGDSRYHANLRVTIALTEAQIDLLPTFDPAPTIPYRVFL